MIMKNQMLFSIAQGQKEKLDPNMQDAFERIVLAGMEFMYANEQTAALSERAISEAEDKPTAIGEGVAGIMLNLSSKSKNSMPWEAGVIAGYALVCDALDSAEQKGLLQVDGTSVDTAMQAYGQKLMDLMGISTDRVHSMMAEAQNKQPEAKQ